MSAQNNTPSDAGSTSPSSRPPDKRLPGDPAESPELARDLIFRGAKYDFEQLTLRDHQGGTIQRQAIRHPGAAVILPILPSNPAPNPSSAQIVFIRNYRFAPRVVLWELPAGTMEPGEDPALTAARELEEEAGYSAATLIPLGRFYTSPGMTDEMMHAYAAVGLRPVGQRLEADENITVHPIAVEEAMAMLDRGELIDGKTVAALLLAERKGLFRGRLG